MKCPAPPPNTDSSRTRATGLGYSLTELILSILIISILAAIMFQFSSNKLRARAERTGCESHLKTLYSGFSTYLTDNGEWPQMPDHKFESDSGPGEENYWEWWITTLKEYNIVEKEWMCPTDLRERNVGEKQSERDKFEGSYVPTHFESGTDAPFRWRQPWLLERGDFHGEGALMIMPDGSIEPSPWQSLQ